MEHFGLGGRNTGRHHSILVALACLCALLATPFLPAQEAASKAPPAGSQGTVVVYASHDRQFSEPVLREFERRSGITVQAVYDTEAVKTVGLVNRLLAERARPRCDVFWNNEVLRSVQLKKEGLTEAYRSPSAASIPAKFRDPDDHWTGFAARARVIMVNRDLLPDEAAWPRTVQDLTNPAWKGRAAFAKPLFGTTNSHACAMWAMAGAEATTKFWEEAMANSVMEAGNAQARDAVRDGELAWCLTDTDDALGAQIDGANVAILLPTEDVAGKGALVIPNSVMLIKNGPNSENGRRLIDYLLSEEVEQELALGRAGQMPLRANLTQPKGLPELANHDVLEVDWEATYDAIAPANAALVRIVGE